MVETLYDFFPTPCSEEHRVGCLKLTVVGRVLIFLPDSSLISLDLQPTRWNTGPRAGTGAGGGGGKYEVCVRNIPARIKSGETYSRTVNVIVFV